MAEQVHVQHLRGTAAANDAYTGLEGEVTYDTTNKALRVHDGVTPGGTKISAVTVDEFMDSESENPLMNKTVVDIYAQIYGSINEVEDIAIDAQTKANNTVMLTGNQTIAGEKTFTDNVKISRPNPTGGTTNAAGLDFVSNELVRGENPSRNCSGEVRFWSKNKAQLMGKMQAEVQTNGTSAIYLEAWENSVGGGAAKAELIYPLNGNPTFKIPTPPANATGQEAVTASWVQANAMRPGLTLKNLAGRGIPGGNLWGALQWDNTPTYNAGGKLSKYGNSIICDAAGWVRICGGFITQATGNAQTVKIGLRQLRSATYVITYNDRKIEQSLAAGDAAYLMWEGMLYVQQGDELTLGAVVQNYLLVESGVFSVEYLGG